MKKYQLVYFDSDQYRMAKLEKLDEDENYGYFCHGLGDTDKQALENLVLNLVGDLEGNE